MAYKLAYSDYITSAGPPDPASWVGPPGPPGPAGPPGVGALNVINVLDHGAKGDGVTDDTAAIQAVLNAYAGKAVVFIPDTGGPYMVQSLTILSGTNLLLNGTLKALPGLIGRLIFLNGANNVTVRGAGVLDGNASVQTGTPWGWEQINSSNVHISGITIQNAKLGNLNVGSSNKTIVDGITIQGGGGAANGFGIGCEDCWLTNSKIDGAGNGDYGFAFYGGVINCGAIGNVVKNCGAGLPTFSPPGIGVLSDGTTGPTTLVCRDIVIANNIIHDCNGGGISVLDVASGSGKQSGIIISNNRSYNNCKQPIDAGSIADCFISQATGVTITGNQFSHAGAASTAVVGIYLGPSVAGAGVMNNQIWNIGQGRTDGAGIWSSNASGVCVSGNYIYDDQTTPTMNYSVIGQFGTKSALIGNDFTLPITITPSADTVMCNAVQGHLAIQNLPTSAGSMSNGGVWRNGGVLNVV